MAQEPEKTKAIKSQEVHPDAHGWEQHHSDAHGWGPGEKIKKEKDGGRWVSRHPDAHGWTHSSHS